MDFKMSDKQKYPFLFLNCKKNWESDLRRHANNNNSNNNNSGERGSSSSSSGDGGLLPHTSFRKIEDNNGNNEIISCNPSAFLQLPAKQKGNIWGGGGGARQNLDIEKGKDVDFGYYHQYNNGDNNNDCDDDNNNNNNFSQYNICKKQNPSSTSLQQQQQQLMLRQQQQQFPQKGIYWAYAARASCLIALLPILFYGKDEKIARYAACAHLLTSPITSFFIQHFSCMRRNVGVNVKSACCIMCGLGYVMGGGGAVILLTGGSDVWVNYLLTVTLCMGSVQFLMVLHKENVIRVMACTAGAVIVVTLAILGSFAPITMSKRFFQSALLPFFVLFLETSRIW